MSYKKVCYSICVCDTLICCRSKDIKGIIITGTGRFFSLGLDIEYFKAQTLDYVDSTRTLNAKLYKRFALLPIPTVAAINGTTL